MKTVTWIVIVASVLVGAVYMFAPVGWGYAAGQAKDAVRAKLADPYSAKFSEIRRDDSAGVYWCGYVNAKNKFGAFVGRQWFIVAMADRSVDLIDPTEPGFDGSCGAAASLRHAVDGLNAR